MFSSYFLFFITTKLYLFSLIGQPLFQPQFFCLIETLTQLYQIFSFFLPSLIYLNQFPIVSFVYLSDFLSIYHCHFGNSARRATTTFLFIQRSLYNSHDFSLFHHTHNQNEKKIIYSRFNRFHVKRYFMYIFQRELTYVGHLIFLRALIAREITVIYI